MWIVFDEALRLYAFTSLFDFSKPVLHVLSVVLFPLSLIEDLIDKVDRADDTAR